MRYLVPEDEVVYTLVDGFAHIPELAFRPGLTDSEIVDLIERRTAYKQKMDAPTISKAQAKRDRRAMKLAKVFGGD